MRFAPGSTISYRDIVGTQVFTAQPRHVVSDQGQEIVTLVWPGIIGLANTAYVNSFTDPAQRDVALRELLSGHWTLSPYRWHSTIWITIFRLDRWSSVSATYAAQDHRFLGYHVDFRTPTRRTDHGLEGRDLLLDLVVTPAGEVTVKDRHEYELAQARGWITPQMHQHVTIEHEQVTDEIEQRHGPFGQDWPTWRMDPHSQPPELPMTRLTEPPRPPSTTAQGLGIP